MLTNPQVQGGFSARTMERRLAALAERSQERPAAKGLQRVRCRHSRHSESA